MWSEGCWSFWTKTEMLDLAWEDNWMGLMEWKCAPACASTPVFVALGNCIHIFLQIQPTVGVLCCAVNCLFLIGSFRQSQPGVQSRSCSRDVRPEWQRTWTGQAIHNSHVWLILHRAGQYVFKRPLMSVHLSAWSVLFNLKPLCIKNDF